MNSSARLCWAGADEVTKKALQGLLDMATKALDTQEN